MDERCRKCEDCINNTWRKALTLCFWNITNCSSHLDDYGSRANGIVNYLSSIGVEANKINNNVVVDSEGRLYIYAETDITCRYLETYYRIWKSVKHKREFGIIAGYLAILPYQYFAAFLELASNANIAPVATSMLSENPLKLEEMVKRELINGNREKAEAAMFALLAKVANLLDEEQLEKLVNLWIKEKLLGMALSILHEAAIISSVGVETLKPSDYKKVLEYADPRAENKLLRLLWFVGKYLEAVSGLEDVIEYGDYERIAVYMKGSRAFIRLGAHHAEASVSGTNIILKYSDHDITRAKVFADFCRRQGWRVSIDEDRGAVEIAVPIEEADKLAKAVAATTSVDVQDLTWIFREARNVEELLRLRVDEYEPD